MQEVRVINGHEYIFELTENEIVGREISAQTFTGYSIKHETDGYITKFYKFFNGEKKEIGKLFYDPDAYKFHLFKSS